MSIKRPRLLLIFVALLAASCGNGVAVTAGGTKISDKQVTRELAAIGRNPDYLSYLARTRHAQLKDSNGHWTKQFVASVVNQQVDFVALQGIAREQNVSPSREQLAVAAQYGAVDVGGAAIYKKFPHWYREQLDGREALLAALRVQAVKGVTPQSYYSGNRAQFVKYCTSDIVLASQDDADKARDAILTGTSFADEAQAVSLDKGTAPKGGDLGCNGPADLVPQLNDPAATLPLGQVSSPIRTDAGWHLLLVRSRGTPPLERVQGEVQTAIQTLSEQRVGDGLRAWLRAHRVTVASKYGTWDANDGKVVG